MGLYLAQGFVAALALAKMAEIGERKEHDGTFMQFVGVVSACFLYACLFASIIALLTQGWEA